MLVTHLRRPAFRSRLSAVIAGAAVLVSGIGLSLSIATVAEAATSTAPPALVSYSTKGVQASGTTRRPVAVDHGRIVVFGSDATNLTDSVYGTPGGIFARDVAT